MQVKRVKLTNAFQHKNLTVDFQPFTSIVGSNGCGKSNVIESIGLALTGVFTLPGNNASTIREGAESGKIELVFTSEGDEYELTAHLGKASRRLKCESKGLLIKKSAEVMEYLERHVLRTPFPVVNSSSIIRQGALEAGLFETQAKRMAAFMRMAGLSNIERKRQQLADAKAAVTIPMLSFSIDDAEAKLKELNEYLSTLDQQRVVIPVTDSDKLQACETLVATSQQAYEAKKELGILDSTREGMTIERGEALSLHNDDVRLVGVLEEGELKIREAADQAKIQIAHAARARRDWGRREDATKLLAKLQAGLGDLVEPDPYNSVSITELEAMLAELTAKSNAAKSTLTAFSDPTAECPTCRRPCTVQESELIINGAKTELNELTVVYNEVLVEKNEAESAKRLHDVRITTYQSTKQSLESQIAIQERVISDLVDVVEPKDVVEFEATVTQYTKLRDDIAGCRKSERESASLLNDVDNELNVVNARIVELKKQSDAQTTEGVISLGEAKVYVEEHKEHIRKAAELNGLIEGTNRQLTDEQARLEKLRKDHEEAKKLTEYTDYLEFARSALHRDNFPSGKIKEFVDRMLVSANVYLDAMQAGFSVSYHKADGFIAYFPQTSKYMRADRLSGGERITFALAFRFAVNDIHTDTGFLILDEPTVWLDDKHIDYVVNSLSLVKAKLVPRVQLIIVTHDERLAAVADSVVEIQK